MSREFFSRPGRLATELWNGRMGFASRRADNSFEDSDYTLWIVIKDLKNQVLYFRTSENLQLRANDLKKLDMKPGAPKKAMSIQGGNGVVDVSGDLR